MVQKLRDEFGGVLLQPGDDGYDAARSVWNGAIDRRPALIARCHSPVDVAAAVAYAQRTGLEVAVRGGGHNYGGAAVLDDGLVIDLTGIADVTVDPSTRRARCGGGATQAQLDAATQEHGLAVTGGTISHTGVGGLTLGGGMGWLTGKCGLAVDNLISAEVVTRRRACVRASADSHPELLWALKGGGGNFGIVTEFEFRLHPVGPLVHLGLMFWELERTSAALRVARDTMNGLPPDAGGMIVALNAPPAPFVPDLHHNWPGIDIVGSGWLYGLNGLIVVYTYFQVPLMVIVFTPALKGLRPSSERRRSTSARRLSSTGGWSASCPVSVPGFDVAAVRQRVRRLRHRRGPGQPGQPDLRWPPDRKASSAQRDPARPAEPCLRAGGRDDRGVAIVMVPTRLLLRRTSRWLR